MKKISITFTALVGVVSIALFFFYYYQNSRKATFDFAATEEQYEEEEDRGSPGFYEDWFDMKQNEFGKIPGGQQRIWARHDKAKLSAFAQLRGPDTTPFEEIDELGPHGVGGRTRALLIDRANENRILAGGVSGGLWESLDGGQSWTPQNDHAESLNITCMAQAPSDASIFYYGTGESPSNAQVTPGAGLFKSTDGGNTFTQLPLPAPDPMTNASPAHFNYIWSVAVDPSHPNIVYVGCGGQKKNYASTQQGGSIPDEIPGDYTEAQTEDRPGHRSSTEFIPTLLIRYSLIGFQTSSFSQMEM